jgi:pimeloyl-ACP methyl ester carboxylesterase
MKDSDSPILFATNLPQLTKPLLVMLPGLDGTGKLFVSQMASLSHYFDVRCLRIPENNRQTWQSLAHSVIEQIVQMHDDRPVYVCGESFGGCLALQIAMDAPKILSHLTVINPASALRHQAWLRWTTQYADYVPEWLFKASGTIALPLLANFDRIGPEERSLFINTVQPISQACVTWRLGMLHAFEAQPERLRNVTVPTALLASGRDRLFPSDREANLLKQYLPNAKTYALPHSGHVCLLENDVDLTDCLKALDHLPVTATSLKTGPRVHR